MHGFSPNFRNMFTPRESRAVQVAASFIRFAQNVNGQESLSQSNCVLVLASLMPNRRVIRSKRPYISLIIVSRASKYENYL